jgi:1-deoxy-D-xylulose-5-phosphate synthase
MTSLDNNQEESTMNPQSSLLENIETPKDFRSYSLEQLKQLSQEMRDAIVHQVSTKGGHFASNLGTIELTIALHKVFNTPEDRLIWDVGHQAYPHKLITGRYKKFHTLKQPGGLSGFLKRSESEYDAFGAGHASTSLAAAMGMAAAFTQQKKPNHTIAVIGDGSLTGGMAYEALNNAGVSKEKTIFVLNDNRMSIAPNVGAVSKYLTRIIANPAYQKVKEEVWDITGKFPTIGEGLRKLVRKVDEGVKHMFLPGGLFEDMGIPYFGPIDGHDLQEMITLFERLKSHDGPCIVHVLTNKGQGFQQAEEDSYKWHASTPFDPETGVRENVGPIPPSLGKVFGNALLEIAKQDERVVAITAAMPDGVCVNIMEQEFPERVYDVGIAEQYAVTFAAGLACEKMKPVVAIYSSFLQRAIDQVVHDVAIQHLNVFFVMSHGGLVGLDGPTHHGAMDLTYLRMIPEMVIMAPSDEKELRNLTYTGHCYDKGPVALRYPKANATGEDQQEPFEKVDIGKPKIQSTGKDILLLGVGPMVHYAQKAAEKLQVEDISCTVADVRFVKPLDKEFYKSLIQEHKCIITIEDNVTAGGYGSGVSELMAEQGIYNKPIKHIGLPDDFVTHGKIVDLHRELGMTEEGIYQSAIKLIEQTLSSFS